MTKDDQDWIFDFSDKNNLPLIFNGDGFSIDIDNRYVWCPHVLLDGVIYRLYFGTNGGEDFKYASSRKHVELVIQKWLLERLSYDEIIMLDIFKKLSLESILRLSQLG